MIARKLRAAALAIGATLGLAACSTYGDGYGGSAYSVGLGYYDGDYYGSPYGYGGYGYGPSYGWYDGFYYPGSGYYVFDRGGRRHAWNDRQRDYWRNRGRDRDGPRNGARDGPRRPAWEGRPDRSALTPEQRQERREAWQARRGQQGVTTDPAARAARREAWRAQRQQQGVTATPRAERTPRRGNGGGNPAWRGRRGQGN